tara:strand:+ start:194 stop:940 length:747 start_codon:yes stop_codon:yes gene_type:complete
MGLKEEIKKVIVVFNLKLDGNLLYKHYNNNTNNFRTNLDAKKAKLLEGPMVQVMSSVASRGGQKGGDLLVEALLIVIFGMTILIYNKQKKSEQKDANYYARGEYGRRAIRNAVSNVADHVGRVGNDARATRLSLAALLKKGDKEKREEEELFHDMTSKSVRANRESQEMRKSKPIGTGSEGEILGRRPQQSEIYEKMKKDAAKKTARSKRRSASLEAAERRRRQSKGKNGGGRKKKKKKRTRKKKRRN